MSEKTTEKSSPVITVADPAPEAPVVEEKQSFIQKTKHFVKTHKKPAIAVGALVALVGVAAVTGRKTEPLPTFEPLELEPASSEDETILVESTDTESA